MRESEASILNLSWGKSAFCTNQTIKWQINTNSMFRQACMGTMLYFVDATVYTGEVMDCKMELENDHDRYAVAVRNKDKKIVGHI